MNKKRTVASEHRDYFNKNKTIVFEQIFTAEQVQAVKKEIERLVIASKNPSQAYMAGRDLWRKSPLLQKIYAQTGVVSIVADLLEKRPIRMGYDQYLPPKGRYLKETDPYQQFLSKPATLQEVSCIQEVACGVFICLDSAEADQTAGNSLLIAADHPFPWQDLQGSHLLLVYALPNAVYVEQPGDPHQHGLRQHGYIFGSRLNDKYHPIVLR